MPWRFGGLLVLIALLIAGRAFAADVTIEATVDSTDVAVSQPFTLTITVVGVQNVSPPGLYDLNGFEATYLGPSTQINIVNFQVSRSISHLYRVVATRAGDLQLGPFPVEVQGQRYETKPITIHVGAAGSARHDRRAQG
jgi:hypothetical protein